MITQSPQGKGCEEEVVVMINEAILNLDLTVTGKLGNFSRMSCYLRTRQVC
jgi:hypothetical protein